MSDHEASQRKTSGTILVVDDEPYVREIISLTLQRSGFVCHQAGSVAEAESALKQHDVDLITCDVNMPDESGLELLGRLSGQSQTKHIPVVMLTARNDTEAVIACTSHGAFGYVLKPVQQAELIFHVRNGLAHRAAMQAREETRRELVALNQSLEDRVAERTVALREREARLQAIINMAADGIMTFDTAGVIESLNSAGCETFGYELDEITGQSVSTLIPLSLDRDHAISQRREFEAVRKDGSVIPVQVTVSEFEAGDRPLFACIFRDLSEQKQLQVELTQAQKLESVGQLAAGIAHEINTPTQYVGDNVRFLRDAFADLDAVLKSVNQLIAAAKGNTLTPDIIASIEAAVQQADLDYLTEEIPLAIEQSLEGVDRVSSIVRAMKEFSHPGADEKSLIDIHEAIRTTITVARNEWKYVADMAPSFDPAVGAVPCLPGEMNQVFLNLIVNAAHAIGEKNGENPTMKGLITVTTRRDGDWAEIQVSDDGGGIPEHVQSRIFDPFFTTKEVGKGTGQGLAIARSVVVDKHGGSLDFTTDQGVGTTFCIRLPITENAAALPDSACVNDQPMAEACSSIAHTY